MGEICDDMVAGALQRVCASEAFVRAPQLRRLLEFLVTCSLAKRQNLKAYTIGVEALGRREDFDPDREAIVRVQASRLRRALDTYYESDGKNDAIRFWLPTGGYVVTCEQQKAASVAASAPARRRNPRFAFACIAFLMITGFGLLLTLGGNSTLGPAPGRVLGFRTAAPVHGNGLPTIVIRPFPLASRPLLPPGSGFRRFIAGAFSHFELLNTVYEPRAELGRGQPAHDASNSGSSSRYDLNFAAVPHGERLELQIQLSDQADGTIVWDGTFEVPSDLANSATQEKIARALATTLLQPFGVVTTRERGKHLATSGDPRYRCVLQAMEALRTASEAAYADARLCLESIIRKDPGYSLAHYYLASIYVRYFEYGLETDPTDGPVLDRAMRAARRAIETNPASSRAQFVLFLIHFNLRDFGAADAAMAKARTLNEFDMVRLAQYGGHLVTLGRIDEGMTILDQIDNAFASRTCTHNFYLFLGHYLRNNLGEAIRHAEELTCLSFPNTFIAKALVATATGDVGAARRAVEALRVFPIWRTDPDGALRRMFPDTKIANRIKRDLDGAGLPANTARRP
jgi:tetratricopeptide (TPR) repeat protein